MDRSTPEDSFLADLEKAAKALSVVNGRTSTVELRRLFDRLQEEQGSSRSPLASSGDKDA